MNEILMNETCMMCDKDATWIRSTQFAGDHPFCEEHAREEKDHGINDSYEYWLQVATEDRENKGRGEYSVRITPN
jgi:hypothetical protein